MVEGMCAGKARRSQARVYQTERWIFELRCGVLRSQCCDCSMSLGESSFHLLHDLCIGGDIRRAFLRQLEICLFSVEGTEEHVGRGTDVPDLPGKSALGAKEYFSSGIASAEETTSFCARLSCFSKTEATVGAGSGFFSRASGKALTLIGPQPLVSLLRGV
jgi:hypothetical protein